MNTQNKSQETHRNDSLVKCASYASVLTAIVIISLKSYGWFITNSAAFFTSLVDSLLDITTSIVNMIAIRFALAPPDHNHRFGHEKIQDLAVFAQSAFFMGAGFFSLIHVISKSSQSYVITNQELGIEVMTWCSVVTIILVAYQSYVVKKTKSEIINVDRLHYLVDFLTDISVITSLYLSTRYKYIDSILGVFISLLIIKGSYRFLVNAVKNLVDEECSDEEKNKIIKILKKNPDVKGVHELKTRKAASKYFIQFHVELDQKISLMDAHEISDEIVREIKMGFENSEVIIHQDPHGVEKNTNYKVI